MDGLRQLGLPVLGIVAAAAITFYVVSFSELSEVRFQVSFSISLADKGSYTILHLLVPGISLNLQKSFRDLDKKDYDDEGYKPSPSSRVKRARRKANKQSKG